MENGFWKKALAFLGVIGAIGGALPLYDRIKTHTIEEIDNYVHERIELKIKEAEANRKGGFRTELTDELKDKGYDIDQEDIPKMFAESYLWVDSLKTFDRVLKPILLFEHQYEAVSLYRRKGDGSYWYKAPDGELYRAHKIHIEGYEWNGYFKYTDQHAKDHVIWIDGN